MSDDCSSITTDITAFSDEDDFSNSSSSFGKYKMVYKVNGMNQEDMECKIENVSMLTCTCINSDYFYMKILFYHKFPCTIIFCTFDVLLLKILIENKTYWSFLSSFANIKATISKRK